MGGGVALGTPKGGTARARRGLLGGSTWRPERRRGARPVERHQSVREEFRSGRRPLLRPGRLTIVLPVPTDSDVADGLARRARMPANAVYQ